MTLPLKHVWPRVSGARAQLNPVSGAGKLRQRAAVVPGTAQVRRPGFPSDRRTGDFQGRQGPRSPGSASWIRLSLAGPVEHRHDPNSQFLLQIIFKFHC